MQPVGAGVVGPGHVEELAPAVDDAVRGAPPVADALDGLGADGAGQLVVEQERRVRRALSLAARSGHAGVGPARDDDGTAHQAVGAIGDAERRGLVGAGQHWRLSSGVRCMLFGQAQPGPQ